MDFDENEDSTPRTNYSSHITFQNLPSVSSSSYYPTDGPSMADLETIMDPHETSTTSTSTENKNSNPTTISDQNIKSPHRKETTLLPPPPPIPTISINTTTSTTYPINKSLNGGLFIHFKQF